jgi:hypothetical protein
MIWLLRVDRPKPTEFAPAMDEATGILPGLPAVAGKPVHVGFDGGRLERNPVRFERNRSFRRSWRIGLA